LEDVLSGMSEGVTLYQRRRFAAAAARFREIRDRADEVAERRQRAQYFLALALFGQREVAEAVRESEIYRSRYGEDKFWAELAYRNAEARLVSEPETARRLFGEIATRQGDTLWGQEARKQLDALERAPRQ
ncbi:MAG: tetratricopeptide repeat protein, partial [Candidatus Binatia bacterium]